MFRLFLAIISASVLALGQARPEFEVASIRMATDQIERVGAGLHIDGAQVALTDLSIKDIVGMAYKVKPNQIAGPDWIGSQRYNIAAKLPDGASQDQVPQMIQSLLADRFQMKMHRESKDLPVYVLGVTKSGAKMSPLPPDPDDDNRGATPSNIAAGGDASGVAINLGKGTTMSIGATALEVKKMDLTQFADLLTRFEDRTVVDETNLKGRYDFNLELTPEDRTAMMIRAALSAGVVLPPQALRLLDVAPNTSLTNSLGKLGLTFDARRAPLEVLVIDNVLRTPTEN